MKKTLIYIAPLFLLSCGLGQLKQASADNGDGGDKALVGKWQSNCVNADVIGFASHTEIADFNSLGQYQREVNYFDMSVCDSVSMSFQVTGRFDVLGPHPVNRTVTQVNYQVEEALLKIHSEEALARVNSMMLCGFDQWQLGIPRDITGIDCEGFILNKGEVIFDVFDFRGSNLYFARKFVFLGDFDNDRRPASVTYDVEYVSF